MKKLLPAAIALLTLLMLPGLSAALADGLTVETEPGLFRVDFILPGENFAIVDFSTSSESGWFTLYSEDGHFTGEGVLRCSYDPCKLTVKTKKVTRKVVDSVRVDCPACPMPEGEAQPFTSPRKGARDLTLTPVVGGISYHFTAEGHGSCWIEWRSVREKGMILVYPDENYVYDGELMLPYLYNQSNVYITIRSGRNKASIGSGTCTKGYELTQTVFEPTEGGRLSGVIVCIDAGHQNAPGGEREPLGPGMEGYGSVAGGMAEGEVTNRRESIVMLECAFVIRDEFLRQGATVVMTREVEDRRYSNLERCAAANEGGAHVMLRLHGDKNRDTKNRGHGVYFPVNSDYAKAVADPETYRAYGEIIMKGLEGHDYGAINKRTVEGTDRFVGNNWAMMPCFLVELGFMSNPVDDILLSVPEYQQWLAEGLADGVYELCVVRGVIGPQE